jgi:hypothetical protein
MKRTVTRRGIGALGLVLALAMAAVPAWAFDAAAYRSRVEAIKAEVETKTLADPKATLARLDELIAAGGVAVREYGARQPKFAKLMEAVIADAAAMKGYSDSEIEGKWGEQGSGGDAAGVPLKSLGQFDETRAAMEMIVGPAHAYIFVNKWVTARKARWLEQARDELVELVEHLKQVH